MSTSKNGQGEVVRSGGNVANTHVSPAPAEHGKLERSEKRVRGARAWLRTPT